MTIEQIQLSYAVFRKRIGFAPMKSKGDNPYIWMGQRKVYGAQPCAGPRVESFAAITELYGL